MSKNKQAEQTQTAVADSAIAKTDPSTAEETAQTSDEQTQEEGGGELESATATAYIEDSLANFIPVAIGFLASLLGLGDLAQKVRKVIDKVQEPINSAIDSVLEMVKGFVMKVAKALGLGGDGKTGESEIGDEIPFW